MILSSHFKKFQKLEPIPTNIQFQKNCKEKTTFTTVVFDIYGTLLISSSGDIGTQNHSKILNAFKNSGIKWNSDINNTELQNTIQKLYVQEIINDHEEKKRKGIDYPEILIESIWERVFNKIQKQLKLILPNSFDFKDFSLNYETLSNLVYPMPEFKFILKTLSEMNLKLGIVSNAQFFTPMLMHYFLGSQDFKKETDLPYFENELCIYSYQQGIAKPSVTLHTKLAHKLQLQKIKPEEVLYIGNDMLNDIYGAQQVGFKTVLFAGDKRSLRLRKDNDKTKNLQPDFIIENLTQILTCLGK